MPLAVHRGDGKLEGGHSTPRRQVPNVGVRFSGLGIHEETVGQFAVLPAIAANQRLLSAFFLYFAASLAGSSAASASVSVGLRHPDTK
jgi:hypothetical protein